MRILLDTCVWGGATAALAEAGHDVLWAGDWPDDPGDEEILARALADGRVLVTVDKDFGELAILRGVPHAGIVRIVQFPARDQARVILEVVRRYANDLGRGALITVDSARVRIRSRVE